MTSAIENRKNEHIDLCAHADVEGARSSLLGQVQLLHEALPERATDEIDLSVELFGRKLSAPILISGMTGGTERAAEINRELAQVAQRFGLGLGLGSQRAMLVRPECAHTYAVRKYAPDVLVLANLGVVQARDLESDRMDELVGGVEADALCIHLNVAQELAQDEGDRDFGGCLDAIERLVDDLPVPVIVKETGCGLGPGTLRRLRAAGVRWVDVSGVGGTSWPGVESLRGSPRQRALGAELREWGVPTAAAILYAREAGLHPIASGGIRNSHDIVRALALGARSASLALPFLRALELDGAAGLSRVAESLVEGVRAFMLLCGANCVADLERVPRVLGPELLAWQALTPLARSASPQRHGPSAKALPSPSIAQRKGQT